MTSYTPLNKNTTAYTAGTKNTATFTPLTKNTTSYTAGTKNSTTFTAELNLNKTNYLLTPLLEYILVGSADDETLILWGDMTYTALTKH